VSAIAAGREPECLDEVDRAVMDFAVKVAANATSVTEEDVDGLRALGLSDADVVDVVLAATARCFFSKTLDALGVQPDAAYLALDAELRETLTVGLPIESA
jgi:alkylhydroperoxidase family enzyme